MPPNQPTNDLIKQPNTQEEAFDLADKVVVFNRGRVEQQGTPTEIIRNPQTPFIMKFVGETNVVPAACQFVKKMRCGWWWLVAVGVVGGGW
jgi:ABC-type Fe3+/spermidine/putrescine transport system ATPase subunit